MCSAVRFGLVIPRINVQKSGVAIFDINIGSRIMRLTILEIGKNRQSLTLLTL